MRRTRTVRLMLAATLGAVGLVLPASAAHASASGPTATVQAPSIVDNLGWWLISYYSTYSSCISDAHYYYNEGIIDGYKCLYGSGRYQLWVSYPE